MIISEICYTSRLVCNKTRTIQDVQEDSEVKYVIIRYLCNRLNFLIVSYRTTVHVAITINKSSLNILNAQRWIKVIIKSEFG